MGILRLLRAASLACLLLNSPAFGDRGDNNLTDGHFRLLQLVNPQVPKQPAINTDFPDPAIFQDKDKKWYAFATSGNNKHIQVATAIDPMGSWTMIDKEPLPRAGNWTTGGKNTWAPDVRIVGNGTYVMYYSGELAKDPRFHCLGAATSSSILGPYNPIDEPLACHLDSGGVIDPSGFLDTATGKRYVVYKIDGNSIGHGGECNNAVKPLVSTPIMLQEVGPDGVTKIGGPVKILDREDRDGPLVEAPNLVRAKDGSYAILFSSHCFSTTLYNVNYAVATDVKGPYKRPASPLVQTGDFNLTSPGGATADADAGVVAFHARCPQGRQGRCMFVGEFGFIGKDVIINGS